MTFQTHKPQTKETSRFAPAGFDPGAIDPPWAEGGDWRLGKGRRKVIEAVPSVTLHWPSTMPQRRDIVKAWHALAMAEIDRANISFRLMAVLKDFVHWKTGLIFPTNATLADRAGNCSERTVSRLIGQYEQIGIIRLRFGWRRSKTGKWLQTRIIFMTLPKSLGFPSKLPHLEDEDQDVEIRIDNGGLGDQPSEVPGHIDTGGLGGIDNGGLSTNERHSEVNAGGDDAA
ncbi:hypothetical protein IE4872_CH01602 [Rhizobium gallicum]|uniref:Helix-turn-helix domain-containing protein n=1 Tax=Rhizobium gallicum TaxID=56730 RepID=A0A1L5NH96_9HYPH|nr:hypothetical protein [Rhizobium gallicum]APO67244.1 hypothetical protein IE4872_CH01602 [Rhizobium gallicum]